MITPTPAKQPACVGFLEVLEDPLHGYTGGLLVVSATGRPLEFHCATPVKPTRAQQILFGATLRAHVCGELIAQALLSAVKLRPQAVMVRDSAAAHPVDFAVTMQLITSDPDKQAFPSLAPDLITIGGSKLQPVDPRACAAETIALLNDLAAHVELDEPFERVREAVREAQRLSTGEDADERAA